MAQGGQSARPTATRTRGLTSFRSMSSLTTVLTGDMTGKSDVERLWDNQDDYNRLKAMTATRSNSTCSRSGFSAMRIRERWTG